MFFVSSIWVAWFMTATGAWQPVPDSPWFLTYNDCVAALPFEREGHVGVVCGERTIFELRFPEEKSK